MGLFFTLFNFALCIGIIIIIFKIIKKFKITMDEINIISKKIDIILDELKKIKHF